MLVQGFNGNNEVDQGIRPMGRSKIVTALVSFQKKKGKWWRRSKSKSSTAAENPFKIFKEKRKENFSETRTRARWMKRNFDGFLIFFQLHDLAIIK